MEIKAENLSYLNRATVVNLRLGTLSLSRRLRAGAVTTDSDEDRIGASKKLLRCPEVDAINAEQAQLRQWIYARTLPSPFRSGMLLLPNTLLREVDEKLIATRDRVRELCERFLAVYAAAIEADKIALRSNWSITDYATPAEIRTRLEMEWSYLEFVTPGTLPADMYGREQEKARAKLAEATDTIQQVLRAEMANLVSHMTDRLTGEKGDGKPKVFRNSLVTNLREFLDLFKARNITDDAALDAIVEKARGLLDGVDPDALRAQAPLRESVAKGFAEIKATLDGMMIPAGTRQISFEEE